MSTLLKRRKGFSLVELSVTILIFGIVLGVIYRLLISSTKSVSRGKMAAAVEQNLRVAMDEIVKDIRQAGYGIGSLPAFTRAGRTEVAFWADIDNDQPTNLIRYYLGPSSELSDTQNPNDAYLYRQDIANPGEGSIPIARGIRFMRLQYYDEDGVPLLNGNGDNAVVESDTNVADLNNNHIPDIVDIRSVQITLVFEADKPDQRISFNNGYAQYSLTTKVYPINLELLARQQNTDNLLEVVITPDPAPGILIGDELQFYATARYEKAGTKDVTTLSSWSSSDTSVATIGTYIPGSPTENNEGLALGVGPGVTTISCSFDGMPSTNSVTLKVGGPETRSVMINGSPTYALIEGSANSVTLTAQVTDIGFGGANIVGARYDVPSKGVGASMAASDGAFDSPVENVWASVDITGWTAAQSPYTFYVRGRDADNPFSWGPAETATLVVMASDNLGPVVENLNVTPSTTIPEGTASITISADLNDTPTGGSNIAYAEVFVNSMGPGGTGDPMTPVDGALDSPLESMTLTLDTSGWLASESPYTVYVIGKDAVGNWGDEASITIDVTAGDNEGPLVISLTGPGDINVGQSYVTITGTASDATTGGSNVVAVEAFADDDPGVGNATPMSPQDGAFDSPSEGFSGNITSFPWPVGSTHTIYARAQDEAGNWGPTNSVFVSVKSSMNGKDAVIALANGSFEVWHGDGLGGFKGMDSYSTGMSTTCLEIADFNDDGHSDVGLGSSSGEIQIWTNDGFGSLGVSPSQVLLHSYEITSLVAADFDRDRAVDLVATTMNGEILLFRNDGTGTLMPSDYLFYEPTHLKYIYRAQSLDMDNDGYPDMVVAGSTSDFSVREFQVQLHPGAGGGRWRTQKHNHHEGKIADLSLGDFDGDGLADVLLALNGSPGGLQLWTSEGDGGFSATPLQVWADSIFSMVSYDYERDGDRDVLIGTEGAVGPEVDVVLNDGSGLFDTFNPKVGDITVPATAVAFGFLDTDNFIDVLSAGASPGSLYSFLQTPTNDLVRTINSPFLSGDAAFVIRVGEFDN